MMAVLSLTAWKSGSDAKSTLAALRCMTGNVQIQIFLCFKASSLLLHIYSFFSLLPLNITRLQISAEHGFNFHNFQWCNSTKLNKTHRFPC